MLKKYGVLIVALVALGVMPFTAAYAVNVDKIEKAAVIGKAAPDFTLKDLDGNDVSLSGFKGKKVVLEWTNHQCPFVLKHYDSGNMQKLQKEQTEKGDVVWLTIRSSAEGKQGFVTPAEAKEIIQERGAAQTAELLDPTGQVGHLYGARTTPHMYVIDEDGVLAYDGAIDDNSSHRPETIEGATNYVVAALESLRHGKPVEQAETQPYGCGVKY
mgnify:FL=1